MPSKIFMYHMGSANVFSRRGSHLPIAPNMIARVPPFILFGVVQEPQPPVDHLRFNAFHRCSDGFVDDARIQPLPPGFEGRIETIQELICFIQFHFVPARSANVICYIVNNLRMATVVSSGLSSDQKWPPGM